MANDFAERFKQVRLAKKLNQTACAEKLEISLQTVNRLECGHRTPDAELAVRIAETFECDLGWLLTGRPSESGVAGSGHSCPLLTVLPEDLAAPAKEVIEGWISLPDLPPGTAAIRSRDDSMSPLIKWGDIVVFDIGVCQSGNLAVLVDQMGQGCIRRVYGTSGQEEYSADNPEYRGRDDQSELKCVGRVRKIIRDVP